MGGRSASRRYGASPWRFTGRAHYQLHLVESSVARQFVPPDMPLVEAFGHTLGGFYLAQYDESPAGAFDELVVLGGLVWNAPTSCAWASHVYVNSRAARDHGKGTFGLPSRCVRFSRDTTGDAQETIALEDGVRKGRTPLLRLHKEATRVGAPGPRISLQLPSFSGRTRHNPALLRYALDLSTNIRPTKPFKVSANAPELASILGGRALCAFTFSHMAMLVRAPVALVARQIAGKGEGASIATQSKARGRRDPGAPLLPAS